MSLSYGRSGSVRRHRHRFEVVRHDRLGRPFVKRCECGREWRWHRGRWVLTQKGKS